MQHRGFSATLPKRFQVVARTGPFLPKAGMLADGVCMLASNFGIPRNLSGPNVTWTLEVTSVLCADSQYLRGA